IRELRNVVERAVALCPGSEITLRDLPDAIFAMATPRVVPVDATNGTQKLRDARGEAEATRIVEALKKHENNRLRAAAELGSSRMTLYTKLRKYGLMQPV